MKNVSFFVEIAAFSLYTGNKQNSVTKGSASMATGMGRGLGPRGFLTEEEKQNMPKVTSKLLLRILSYLRPYWFQFLLVFVAIFLSATVGLLPSIITGRIVDEALVGESMGLLLRLILAALAAFGVFNNPTDAKNF